MDAQDEEERARDGIVGEGPRSLIDDELTINNNDNKTEEDVKEQSEWAPHSQYVVQVPPQQPQGSAFHWESFLHVRSIKVLLVENDDSTRHVVTALLCNSNYEVIVAANGLQAWKILEDLRNHIDLVLTEVAVPCLSGIDLLCKIMSHPIRNNIPVIMMSSYDSMGLVFKCLSKGAVDFLLKPIRKNELKILWQHIWRRCHSSSGSGSENDSETRISVKSKTSVKFDNNSGSNDRDYYGSTDLKVDDESDNGSDGQSSWTKEAVEVYRPQVASPCLQIADCPESTCAQVVRSNAIISDYVAKGKELVISTEENPIPILHSTLDSKRTDEQPENASGEYSPKKHKVEINASGEYSPKKHKVVLNNKVDPQMDSEIEGPREPVNILEENNKAIDDPKELPLVGLRGVEDTQETVQSDHNVSRHFVLSALSRYNRTSNAIEVSDTGSSSLLLKNLEFVKKQSVCKVRNNEDTGSTTNELSVNPLVLKNKSEATLRINGLHPSSALLPKCPPQQLILVKAENIASNVMVAPPSGSHQELPVQHIHHHHHLHHFHNIETQEPLPNQNDFTADTHCGSSNFTSLPIGFNLGNYCSYRSASGSNNLNGSKTAVNGGAVNVESDVGLVGKIASVNASGSGSGKRIDENKSSEREAALTKFCQKRKARCFRKKGRYQNRKRLTEQRPGLRGQFVKQMGDDDSANGS